MCVAVCWCVLQYVAACCSVLQCVAVCCSVLQCVTLCCNGLPIDWLWDPIFRTKYEFVEKQKLVEPQSYLVITEQSWYKVLCYELVNFAIEICLFNSGIQISCQIMRKNFWESRISESHRRSAEPSEDFLKFSWLRIKLSIKSIRDECVTTSCSGTPSLSTFFFHFLCGNTVEIVDTYKYTCWKEIMCIYIHAYVQIFTCICKHVYIHAHTHTHIYTLTHMHAYLYEFMFGGELVCESHHLYPQTEEIGLYMITSANISNKFSQESPYTSNTFSRESPKFRRRKSDFTWLRLPWFPTSFHRSPRTHQTRFLGSPQNFKQDFTWVNGVSVTQKSGRENRRIWRSKYLKSDLLREWKWVMSHVTESIWWAWLVHVRCGSFVCDMTRSYVCYGVAPSSRLLKITGLFCRISSI